MRFLLIFISPNGTTKKTTLILKNIIEKHNYEVNLIDIGQKNFRENHDYIFDNIRSADLVGFGSPVYHMDILQPMKMLFTEMLDKHKESPFNIKTFFYFNYGGITVGKAFENAGKIFAKMKIDIIGALRLTAPHFHHKEDFPNTNTIEFVEKFFMMMMDKNFIPIDNVKLKYIFSPDKKRVNIIYPFIHIVGKNRELPIKIDKDKCKSCKKCLNECPAGALKFTDAINIDFSFCIHCYHCFSCCPFGAINCQVEKLDDMIKVNKKIIGTENPPNKIYI